MAEKKEKKQREKLAVFIFVLCVAMVGALIIYYQFMRKQQLQNSEQSPSTETEKLIAKNLDEGYPETVNEVMKLWGRMNQCLYNTSMNDDDFEAMIKQLRLLYSSQFLAQNEEKSHIESMKAEMKSFQKEKKKIVSYSLDTGTSVKYKTINNQECAETELYYFVNNSGDYVKVFQDFILVKEDDKWKVLGFQEEKEQPSSESEAKKSA